MRRAKEGWGVLIPQCQLHDQKNGQNRLHKIQNCTVSMNKKTLLFSSLTETHEETDECAKKKLN
jgi:hypothetical protein